MALLQTVEEMRRRMGFADEEEINRAVEAALETASIVVPSMSRFEVTRATVVDLFFVRNSYEFGFSQPRQISPRGRWTATSATQTVLRLSRPLVVTSPTHTVEVAGTEIGLDTSSVKDLRSPDEFTILDADNGVLRINDFGLGNAYVRVSYTSGLLTDDGDPALFSGVPDWLTQAVSMSAQLGLNANPVVRATPLAPDERESIKTQMDSLILDNSRYIPMSWKPINTAVTLV